MLFHGGIEGATASITQHYKELTIYIFMIFAYFKEYDLAHSVKVSNQRAV